MPADSERAAALTPYNVSLASVSPIFDYQPLRDTDAGNVTLSASTRMSAIELIFAQGWNATYTGGYAPTDSIPTDRAPARVTYRRTQKAGTYIAVTFEGTGVYLCISARGAAYALTVDGASVESSAPTSSDRACDLAQGNADTLLYARGLAYGAHSVRLDVTAAAADREFRFFGGALEIGVQTGGKAVKDSTLVDDLSPSGWTLVPGRGKNMWDTFTDDSRFLSRTLTFNCIYDKTYTATYTFSGAGGAVLIGGIWPHAHGLSVQLDDAPPVNLDATAGSFATSTPFFLAGALDPAVEHRITVRDFNSDMPNCTFYACCALVDEVQLLRAAADDLDHPSAHVDPTSSTQPERPGSNPTSSAYHEPPRKPGTGVIAGSVGGAVVALALIVLLVIALRRRRRRRSQPHHTPPKQDQSTYLRPYTLMGSPSPRPATDDSKRRDLFDKEPRSDRESRTFTLDSPKPQAASNSDGGSTRPRMAGEDLELVLAFVAQRMDKLAPRVAPGGDGHRSSPEYRV